EGDTEPVLTVRSHARTTWREEKWIVRILHILQVVIQRFDPALRIRFLVCAAAVPAAIRRCSGSKIRLRLCIEICPRYVLEIHLDVRIVRIPLLNELVLVRTLDL